MDQTPSAPRGSSLIKYIIIAVLIVAVLGVGAYAYVKKSQQQAAPQTPPQQQTNSLIPSAFASKFATYEELPVTITPNVTPYTVKTDLSNVENIKKFPDQTEEQQKHLATHAFYIQHSYGDEFFQLYEGNRYADAPSFITTDSVLHNYHLVFDQLLKRLEETKLIAEEKSLAQAMLNGSIAQYNALKGTEWENAAQRNIGFFAIALKLVDPSTKLPDTAPAETQKELDLIAKHEVIAESPLINRGAVYTEKFDTPYGALSKEALKEDYTQYIPRGHYTKSAELKNYFKSMMWLGRITFTFEKPDLVRSSLLMTQFINKPETQASWERLYEPINFFVGKSDDVAYYQVKDIYEQVYTGGERADTKQLVSDSAKFTNFVNELRKLDPPQINSMPIFNKDIQPDRKKVIQGFRFMGQRFTIDASIFQRLIDREVEGRMLPKGLDIPAAMGSTEALNILTEMGETTKYREYSDVMNKMQTYVKAIPQENWTQNLYWGWLHVLRSLIGEKPNGYPTFMRSSAWTRKELNTYLGSWTELKHDTILYAKQVYAELGGGPGEEPEQTKGYVEPNPYLYARLASLLQMTHDGLDARKLLTKENADTIDKLKTLVTSLKTISEKELTNAPLTKDEYDLIYTYGGQLEHIWTDIFAQEMAEKHQSARDFLNGNPSALVADVATDPNGEVLEEGTGHVDEIYVVVPIEGKLYLTKGGVYSYYEFTMPIANRMTDESWRELIRGASEDKQAPKSPEWTQLFAAE